MVNFFNRSTSTAAKKAAAAKKIAAATPENKAAAKILENDGIFKTFAKNNTGKLIAAGVTASALALYMASTGETNPAKALGDMVGDVGEGLGEGIGATVTGLCDGLGLSAYATYIQLGCVGCSCLCCLLLVTYLFMQFKK